MRRGILADTEEIRALRGRIGRRPFNTFYDMMMKRCALILEAAPITEPQWRSLYQQGHFAAALNAARATQGRILDLVVAHHVDRNLAYRNRAIEEFRNLLNWSSWTDPSHGKLHVDLCTAEVAVAVTLGLDWLWDDLPAGDRAHARKLLGERVVEAYRQAVEADEWWATCYHAWNAVINGGLGLAALALAGDDTDDSDPARQVYQSACRSLEHFFNSLGREGGWDEGTGYWGYAMRYLLLLAEGARRLEDDQSLLHKRGMDETGRFPIYFSPHGQPASFGDAQVVPLYGALYLLSRHFEVPELTWWLDTYSFHRDVSTTGWSAAALALLFRPDDPVDEEGPGLEPLKVFHQIGWAAMADRWPRPAMYVAAKTGDLASHHNHSDMNTIQLQVDGEMLLTDIGTGNHGGETPVGREEGFYEVAARAHNTITIAEEDHRIDAQGQILDSRAEKDYRWVLCDAGQACSENATFHRHVVLLGEAGADDQMLVVLDELNVGVPEKVELFWHTQGQIELDAKASGGVLRGRRSQVHFALDTNVSPKLAVTSHDVRPGVVDRVLHISAGGMGEVRLVSVFARRPVAGEVRLVESPEATAIQAGPWQLSFQPGAKTLQFKAVERR
jgi:hypothetical protein